MTQTEPGTQVYVTWAYDGSGVALRSRATVIDQRDGSVTIGSIATDEARKALCGNGIITTVPRANISALKSYPHVASFGWLD